MSEIAELKQSIEDLRKQVAALTKVVTQNSYFKRVLETDEEQHVNAVQGSAELLREAIGSFSWEAIAELTSGWSVDFKKQVSSLLSPEEKKACRVLKEVYTQYILPLESKLEEAREKARKEFQLQMKNQIEQVKVEKVIEEVKVCQQPTQQPQPSVKPREKTVYEKQKEVAQEKNKKREDVLSRVPSLKNIPTMSKIGGVSTDEAWATPSVVEGSEQKDSFQGVTDLEAEEKEARASLYSW